MNGEGGGAIKEVGHNFAWADEGMAGVVHGLVMVIVGGARW